MSEPTYITPMEFDARWKEYEKEIGPNPGSNWLGKWGWYVVNRGKLAKSLKEQNILIRKGNEDA